MNLPKTAFVLFLIFLVLKLAGLIKWSWIWVTSPLWIWAIFAAGVFTALLVAAWISKGERQ